MRDRAVARRDRRLPIDRRDPIITAKEVASLDRLSGGRFLFGVGAGWNVEEMRDHGTDPRRRFGILRERVEAVKEIWASAEATYHGAYVNFDRIWCWPKPLQDPHPPILVGGNGDRVLDRVIAYGDEWMPNRVGDDDAMLARFGELRERAAEAGRGTIPITVAGMMRDPARIERFEQAGVTRGFFWIQADRRDAVEAELDRYTEAVRSYATAGG